MRENIKLALSDNLIKISIATSSILIVTQVILTVLFVPKFPPLIPFLNSQPWGPDRLFPAAIAFLIPFSFIIIFLINNSASAIFYQKNTLAARILSFNALLFIFLGILAFVQIIFLVF